MTTLWETETERLVLVVDEWPERPYDDGSTPVLEWDVCAGTVKQSGPDTSYTIPSCDLSALRHFLGSDPTALSWNRRDREEALHLFARWLHIYRGVTTEPLVFDMSGEMVYVSYCPGDWRQALGVDDSCRPNMDEWRAYLDGDVYVALLQRKVHWTAAETGETRETWETFDAVGGVYGYEWAETDALAHFPEPKPTACRYCARAIVLDGDIWVDPEATGDDAIWRETCDSHDTFTAEHFPVGESA